MKSILKSTFFFLLKFSIVYGVLFVIWLPFAIWNESDFGDGWVAAGAVLGAIVVNTQYVRRLPKSPRNPRYVLYVSLYKLILVVVLFFSSWGATIFLGVPDVNQHLLNLFESNTEGYRRLEYPPHGDSDEDLTPPWYFVGNASSQFPFLVGVDVHGLAGPLAGSGGRSYYFWFFGLKIRLPFLYRGYWIS